MPLKTEKNYSQKLLIIGTKLFLQYCHPAQYQPKSHILFHKKGSLRDFYVMTLLIGCGEKLGLIMVQVAKALMEIEIGDFIGEVSKLSTDRKRGKEAWRPIHFS